jgi:hypothetical protein
MACTNESLANMGVKVSTLWSLSNLCRVVDCGDVVQCEGARAKGQRAKDDKIPRV